MVSQTEIPSLAVLEYSEENFIYSLSNEYCSPEEVAQLDRVKYLLGYLSEKSIKPGTIVIEYGYIDGDYLDDYASYYVRCFRQYGHRCKRVHFFGEKFSRAEFIEFVHDDMPVDKTQAFKTSYRGFIVARPLPAAIIGRTVLATYPPDENRRQYPCIKLCVAHLYGVELSVKSLEYQEQDTVLAACATVALWSCFHKTNEMFQTPIWSPATITRIATQAIHASRVFPSNGLNPSQMQNAILQNGLVAEFISYNPDIQLVPLLYGYMKFGLPVLLVVDVEGKDHHAITLTGYSLRSGTTLPDSENNIIPLNAERIDEFYAHDDQIGPFSRIRVIAKELDIEKEGVTEVEKKPNIVEFDGSWKNEDGTYRKLRPKLIIIPTYHKIRVTFIDIQIRLAALNWAMFNIDKTLGKSHLDWDLFLTTSNDMKRDIKQANHLVSEELDSVLLSQHPRFIWRAILKSGDISVLELFADATDMARSFPIYQIIVYDDSFRTGLSKLVNDPSEEPRLKKENDSAICQVSQGEIATKKVTQA